MEGLRASFQQTMEDLRKEKVAILFQLSFDFSGFFSFLLIGDARKTAGVWESEAGGREQEGKAWGPRKGILNV